MPKVEIYSTDTCHFCHLAKDFFNAHNIPFTDYNVGKDTVKRKEAIEKSGQMGVPVITIDKEVIVGFDRDRIAELLGIA
jgi:glutaredoxin 3